MGLFLLLFTSDIEIDNSLVRVYLDSVSFALKRIEDLKEGYAAEFVSSSSPIWRLNLLDTSLSPVPLDGLLSLFSSDLTCEKSYNIDTLSEGPALHLWWKDMNISGDGKIDVKVDILLRWNESIPEWYITVYNYTEKYAIFSTDFPCISFLPLDEDAEDDVLILPALSGTLLKSPFMNVNQKVLNEQDLSTYGGAFPGSYPGIYVMQFEFVYDTLSTHGLYLATKDTAGYAKRYNTTSSEDFSSIFYFVRHYPENNNTVQSYSLPYPCLVGPFKGDWIDAAKFYRDWAISQHWCNKGILKDRGDFPESAEKKVLVVTNEVSEFGSASSVLSSLRDLKEFFGDELWLVSHLRGWGRWLPYVDPHPGVEELIDSLSNLGIATAPYSNTRLWDISTPDDGEKTREKSMAKNINLEPYISVEYDSYVMDPWTESWQEKYAYIVDAIHKDLGATDIYVDNFPSFKLCYESTHGHPSGGGNYWIEGFRNLAKRVRNEERAVDTNFTMTQEDRVELEIEFFDFLFTQYWEDPPARGNPGPPYTVNDGEPIPLFTAVYHDYVATLGGTNKPWGWYGKNHFAFANAYNFVNGNRFLLYDEKDYVSEFSDQKLEDFNYLKELVLHSLWGKEYLLYGEWMRPPMVEAPITSVEFYDKTRYFPEVLSGAFKRDGKLGIALTNFSSDTVEATCTVDLKDYGFNSGSYEVSIIDSTGAHLIDKFDGDVYIYEKTFPPKTACVLEIKPSSGIKEEDKFEFLIDVPSFVTDKVEVEYMVYTEDPVMVEISIYNIAGRKIETLVKGIRERGRYRVTWEGGSGGVYFCNFKIEGKTVLNKKIILLK